MSDTMPNTIKYHDGITGPLKMQFFSIVSFLNDLKFYDEERNELS